MGRRAPQRSAPASRALGNGHESGSVILAAVVLLATVLAVAAATVPLLAASGEQMAWGRQRVGAQALVDGLAGAEAAVVRAAWPSSEAKAYTTTCSSESSGGSQCPSAFTSLILRWTLLSAGDRATATWRVSVYDDAAPYTSEWNASGEVAGLPQWDSNEDHRVWVVAHATVGGVTRSRASLVTAESISAPSGWISEFFFSSSHGSFMIAAGPDGNLWFTEPSANKIGKITTEGKITEYAIPTAYSSPGGITGGPDGNVWFTESSANKIARITPAGAITEFPLSSGSAHQPIGITSGPDGRLWFAEYAANKIGRITTAGAITEFALPTTGTGIQQITRGPDGRLWFTEWFAGKVGKITTSGSIVEYTLPSDLYRYPLGITSGPDGNLWFVEWGPANKIAKITTSGQLTEYPIPTEPPNEYPYPYGIAAGADGNLWFTLQGGNRIGRITTAGAITQYKASTASGPTGIAAGPDGNLWFTEYYTGRIGRISPGE